MTINTLLLDLDGTLVDTAADFVVVLNAIRRDLNLADLPEQIIRHAVSDGARGMIAQGLPEAAQGGFPDTESLRLRFLNDYTELLLNKKTHARPYPGIRDLLDQLSAKQWQWGIVTNKPVAMATPLLDALDLTPPVLICPDHVATAKPAPDGLLLACQELGISPLQAIYVGDHQRDIEAGQRAGMPTIAATWGYLAPGEQAEQWQADTLCSDSRDLLNSVLTLSNARQASP